MDPHANKSHTENPLILDLFSNEMTALQHISKQFQIFGKENNIRKPNKWPKMVKRGSRIALPRTIFCHFLTLGIPWWAPQGSSYSSIIFYYSPLKISVKITKICCLVELDGSKMVPANPTPDWLVSPVCCIWFKK